MPTATSPPPTRVLIPEAREHQHRRYWRTGLAAVLGALALAGLIAVLVALTAGAAPRTSSSGASGFAAAAAARRGVLVRPVLCEAPPFSASPATSSAPMTCAPPYLETPAALDVQPMHDGFTESTRTPDPALAADRTSTHDNASATVLLGVTGTGTAPRGTRLLLGPSVMRLSHSNVVGASIRPAPGGTWNVLVRLDSSGALRWDTVGFQFFHGQVAMDFGGRVVSAPLIEPTTASFASAEGRLNISGSLSHHEAGELAAALTAPPSR